MNAELAEEPVSLRPLLQAAFQAWNQAGIPFVVLRNHERLPETTSNDVDVLVPQDQLSQAELLLLQAAARADYQLHHRAQFDPVSLFFHHAQHWHIVQIDLFGRLAWRGIPLLDSSAVLGRRRLRGEFAVPDPLDEAVLNLLLRLLYQGHVREKYREGIRQIAREDAPAFVGRLQEIFGAAAAAQITGWVLAGDWSAIESRVWSWRCRLLGRRLRTQPGATLTEVWADLRRLWRRWLQPPGLLVVLLGPDGCGKSAVARELFQALRPTFQPDKSLLGHWKPKVFPLPHRAGRLPTTAPHAQPPRKPWLSRILLCAHWVEYALGYWVQFRPVLFRNGLVLMDRYHYDFEVDPRRYRLQVPPDTVRRWFGLLPEPDLVFVLDAPVEVLRHRKQEVPEEETQRQQTAYRALTTRLRQAQLVDTTQPLPEVVQELRKRILQHLRRRLEQAGGG